MADCCQDKACALEALQQRQSTTLKIVLLINLVMFVVELSAGLLAHSISLIADSLDMLGDSLVYIFSLYVVARSARMKAKAALLKGCIMAAFGVFVLAQAIHKMLYPQTPVFELIGLIGLLALLANGVCAYLLSRHRQDDINMSSVWLCSRNDIIANVCVIFAAVGVWFTASAWPDIIVGLALSALFLRSATYVLRQAFAELR